LTAVSFAVVVSGKVGEMTELRSDEVAVVIG
jgi:hypothetical protein